MSHAAQEKSKQSQILGFSKMGLSYLFTWMIPRLLFIINGGLPF